MEDIYKDWNDYKSLCIIRHLRIQYNENDEYYNLFASEGNFLWKCVITKNTDDATDFENNYKNNCNQPCVPLSEDGKQYIRAESRPLNCTTYFTSCGDIIGETPSIGTGDRLEWDASISGEWTTDGCPDGFKKKEVIIQFVDSIWIKDGTLYYMDVKKGSLIDMEVLCPNGGYYMYLGEIYQNTSGNDLVVDHYINKMPIQDNVPMGDELNTETCSQELPNYLKYRFTVTIPTSDVTSYGYGLFEIYRQRTVII